MRPQPPAPPPGQLLDRLWSKEMGGDRLLFIARPEAAMREVFDVATREQGIQAATGLAMFPLVNWHQTLSDRFIDSPQTRALLLQAGQAVQARGFLLSLDQLRVSPNARASANIELCCSQPVDALKELLLALKLAIADQGLLTSRKGHRPHVTLSYRYDVEARRQRIKPIRAIDWPIESFELAIGSGDPYRYRTLSRWTLAPAATQPVQAAFSL
ncbi:2'-5' RNA ligase [Pseudoxanthomonas winnipegensis]|uniref:2'-5' RNA ligase n=2 Tax=Pseudoxanthomonas TaxID=83618 RepID=A0AAW8GFG0_9GAMM|nr:2'-5' RNA ligase family protein [Pseudoxanthomonas winnipegensis]MDQ1119761.1 2'-5' RNA ligase [Pseudoxanthomonas winnipegensis]MDQ1132959.1 2'-5' RNA ligase [Pseudoxanthomonas winnipegensis]